MIDTDIQEIIKDDINDHELREMAIKKGMLSLRDKLIRLLKLGDTSLDEVIRIGV